ncbi:serine hydrolase domain-containing protein [Danxiaibacter flavus]|uniref:Serine hydrolase domain-containing protein n=1 Tax=Danxiaibacter flavus TaxID=3049108 RepID=A0ABV3ZGP7_9BACT|nr:serine hydrolase domain-containing protein [Chitinophagaceae bacterium DXS]
MKNNDLKLLLPSFSIVKFPLSITFLLIIGLIVSFSGKAQLSQKLDSLFKSQSPTEPGFALMIRQNGKEIYNNVVGMANDSIGYKITDRTNFRMASVSKQFTAMAILLLEKDGKLSVNDPISEYFPELPANVGKPVLVRHLLTHSSGIIDYESLIPDTRTTQVLDKDILDLIAHTDTTYFKPGTQFRYSNSGFCLLALIIERVSHRSFASFIKTRIFAPLQMTESTVYEKDSLIQYRAMGYARDNNGRIIFSDQSITSATKGDGGIYTSLHDYAKWTKALEQNKLIDLSAALKRLHFAINNWPDRYYAAGWFELIGSEHVLFHSGSTCGFNNYVILIPEKKVSIVFFSNLDDRLATFEAIIQILKSEGFGDFSDVFWLHRLTS